VITIQTLKDMLLDLKRKTSKDIHDELMPFIIPIKDMEKELFGAPLSCVPFGDGDTYRLIRFLSKRVEMMEGCTQFAYIAPGNGTNVDTNEKKKVFLLFVVESYNKVWVGTWDYESEDYIVDPLELGEDDAKGDLMVAMKLFAYQLACVKNGVLKPDFYKQAVDIVQSTMTVLIERQRTSDGSLTTTQESE
jgi:hypothetical protein